MSPTIQLIIRVSNVLTRSMTFRSLTCRVARNRIKAARPKERKRDIAKPLRTPPSEKLYLAACGNSSEQPIGDFLMLTMTRYKDQSLWHGNVFRVLSSVVDCTFNPGFVERLSRWGLGGQYNSGFPASRCHISSRIFWRALFAITPYP